MQNKQKKTQINHLILKDFISIDSVKNDIKETVDKKKKERYSLLQPNTTSNKKDKQSKRN